MHIGEMLRNKYLNALEYSVAYLFKYASFFKLNNKIFNFKVILRSSYSNKIGT